MKLLMLLGGLLGFSIGIAFGMIQGSSWSSVLLRASVSAYLAGVLMRWWGRVWLRSLHQAHTEQLAQADEAASTPRPIRAKS